MAEAFIIEAETRNVKGTGASRRLRRLDAKLPAIVYGAGKEPTPITLALKDLVKQLENEAFFSQILTLRVDGKDEKVVLKDLQRHPAKEIPMHADFQRIDASQKLVMNVPLHFINEAKCVGVKLEGGIISHLLTNIEITCYAKDLPEYLELDVTDLKVGHAYHLSDIQLPEGVSIPALQQSDANNLTVVNVSKVRGSDTEESEGETETPTEPEA